MREIKFRAWSKSLGMSDPFYLKDCGEASDIGEFTDYMQFTGLLDKNGKEIYEGDIIKVTGEFAIDYYGIVKWSQQEDDYTYHCGFMVDWQEEVKRRSHLSFWANHREIEIIGNIYENPELLKEATL